VRIVLAEIEHQTLVATAFPWHNAAVRRR
jgi:hypothetical protein